MSAKQEDALGKSGEENKDSLTPGTTNNNALETSEEITQFYNDQILSAEHTEDEITNNDGSVIETLDTDFHNIPGYINRHSLAGSNRADYYEQRSQGKSDTEEEQEYIRNHPKE
jgi:hypothetical protein